MCSEDLRKLTELAFVGPGGPYKVILPMETSDFEDQPIDVVINGARSEWIVEVDEVDGGGARRLSGMTRDKSGLWFELVLTNPAQLRYWGNQELVRADLEVRGSV